MKARHGFTQAVLFVTLLGSVASAREAASAPVSTRRQPAKMLNRIVFSTDRSGAWRIWLVNADGSGMARLTRDKGDHHDVDPVFSPDGRTVLLTSTRGGGKGVWRMTLDGSKLDRLCDGEQAEWAPDGKRIVFVREGRLFARELASGKERPVTTKAWTRCSGPAWGPDGKGIAFAARQDGRNAIFIVAAEGGAPKKVYDAKGACEPHWSPDGRRIVYETETHICTVRPDGTGNRLITYYGGVQRYARFNPDGKHLVFCQGASPRGPWELYIVPSLGGTPRRLTEGGSDMYPDWR